MKIEYHKGIGIILAFPKEEFKVALSVLKAIYTVSPLTFVKEAIEDIEMDMQPKKLELVVHNHICDRCFMMVNDKDENSLKVVHDGDIMWRHRTCKELKNDRPN